VHSMYVCHVINADVWNLIRQYLHRRRSASRQTCLLLAVGGTAEQLASSRFITRHSQTHAAGSHVCEEEERAD